MPQSRTRVIVLLCGLSLAALAAHETAAWRMREAARGALAAVQGTAAQIEADPVSGRVTLKGVAVAQADFTLGLDRLTFDAGPVWPSLIAPARAQAGAAHVDDLVVEFGGAVYRIKSLEAAGALSSADLARLVDPAGATPFAERVGALDAASIEAPEVKVEAKSVAGASQTFIFHDVKLASVVHGKAARVTIAGGDVAGEDARSGAMTGAYGAMTLEDLDIAAVARVASTTRTTDEPLTPLYSTLTIERFAYQTAASSVAAGRATAKGVAGRPLATSLASVQSVLADKEAPGRVKTLATFLSDVFGSFSVASIAINDLKTSASAKDVVTETGIDAVALTDVGHDRIGSLTISGVRSTAKRLILRVGEAGLRDVDFGRALQAWAASGGEADPSGGRSMLAPQIAQFYIADIAFEAPNERGAGNAENGEVTRGKAGRLQFDSSDYIDGLPAKAAVELRDLQFDVPADAVWKPYTALGYAAFNLSSRAAVAWNADKRELTVTELSAKGLDTASLRIAGLFGNVSRDVFSPQPAVMQAAALAAVLKSTAVTIEDHGLVDRLITQNARNANTPAAQYRSQIVAAAAVGIPAYFDNAPAGKLIGNAVAKFLAAPKTLSLSAASTEGLGASDFAAGTPGDIIRRLDVKASANE